MFAKHLTFQLKRCTLRTAEDKQQERRVLDNAKRLQKNLFFSEFFVCLFSKSINKSSKIEPPQLFIYIIRDLFSDFQTIYLFGQCALHQLERLQVNKETRNFPISIRIVCNAFGAWCRLPVASIRLQVTWIEDAAFAD